MAGPFRTLTVLSPSESPPPCCHPFCRAPTPIRGLNRDTVLGETDHSDTFGVGLAGLWETRGTAQHQRDFKSPSLTNKVLPACRNKARTEPVQRKALVVQALVLSGRRTGSWGFSCPSRLGASSSAEEGSLTTPPATPTTNSG